MDDHDTSELFIPRRSARIQSRLINSRPNSQDILNIDRREKADASGQSDITTGDDSSDDRRKPKLTRPQSEKKEGTESATEQEKEVELVDLVQQTACDDGDEGENNIDTAHKEAEAADSQGPVDYYYLFFTTPSGSTKHNTEVQ